MVESTRHHLLKAQAKAMLLAKGYREEDIIIDKKWIEVEFYGTLKRFRVDVYGKNGHEIAVECGNFPIIKRPLYKKYFGEEHVLHLPYPKGFGKTKLIGGEQRTKKDATDFLIRAYQMYVFEAFKGDPVFDFAEFKEETRSLFDCDDHRTFRELNPDWSDAAEEKGRDVWMNFPDSKIISKQEYKNKIHWGMIHYGNNTVAVTVMFGGSKPCKEFLKLSEDTHRTIFEELKKLPENFRIRDGISFWEKSSLPPLDKEWNDPIPCTELTWEDYESIRENLELCITAQENGLKVGPVLDLVKVFCQIDELPDIIDQLKGVYKILLRSETTVDVIARDIKKLPDWAWYVLEKSQQNSLKKEYEKTFGSCQDTDFRAALRKLRFDSDFVRYKSE